MPWSPRISLAEYDSQQNSYYIPRQTSDVGRFMFGSSTRILSLLLTRFPAWLLQRILHIPVSPLIVVLAVAALSAGVTLVEIRQMGLEEMIALGWIVYFSILVVLLFVFPRIAWLRLVAISDNIDKLFLTRDDARTYIDFVAYRLRPARQLAFSALTSAFAVVALVVSESHFLQGRLFWGEIVLAALLGFLGGNAVYWLWSVPNFILRLGRFERLNLSLLSPAHTPAVLALSRLLGTSSVLAMIGALMLVLPLVYYALQFASAWGQLNVVAVGIGCLGTVLFVAVAPQWALARMGRRHREDTLDSVTAQLNGYRTGTLELPSELAALGRAFGLMVVYQQVLRAPNLAVQTDVVVKYVVSLISTLSPILTLLVRSQ